MIALASAAFTFAVYLATMPPALTWAHYGADGGDLVSAIARGALPHPPGFPAYLFVGDVFIHIPFGEPAWRLNVLSAAFAAGAVALTIAASRRAGASVIAACGAGLMLGFAPLFWSQAIIVEVYAFAAFCASLVMYLALRGAPTWLSGLVLGLGTGAHPLVVFAAPMIFDSQVASLGDSARPRERPVQKSLTLLFSLSIGWLAMYGVVLLAHNRAPSPWGDVTTLGGWWSFVVGEIYRGYLFALPLADLPQRVISFAATVARQFTPLGALIAGAGAARLWREQRARALASLATFALVSIFVIAYNTADSLVYLVVALPAAALWLALGLTSLTVYVSHFTLRALRFTLYVLFLCLPFLSLALFWNETNLHDDRAAMEWANQVLRAAPANAILVTERDAHTFTLWYARDVLRMRPDVIVLDRDLWQFESYRKMMTDQFGFENDLAIDRAAQKTGRSLVEVLQ